MPYKQDLPPEGGYAPINYKRIPAKSVHAIQAGSSPRGRLCPDQLQEDSCQERPCHTSRIFPQREAMPRSTTRGFLPRASMPYKQDLPPEGGYAPINYKRIP